MPALDCSALVDGRIRTSSVHELEQRYSEVMFVYSNIYFNRGGDVLFVIIVIISVKPLVIETKRE